GSRSRNFRINDVFTTPGIVRYETKLASAIPIPTLPSHFTALLISLFSFYKPSKTGGFLIGLSHLEFHPISLSPSRMADYAGLGYWDDVCSQPRVKSFAQNPAAQGSTHCRLAESYSLLCPTLATDDSGLYEGVETTTLWKYNYPNESCLRLQLCMRSR
ncbi:hypothetical protein CROQUDRAFT_101600, partial [Cronartium quercuum f. sp. fusiforme G11]